MTVDIRKYIKDLDIGPDDDAGALKKSFYDEIVKNGEDTASVMEILDDLALEASERLAQVTDEDRAATLERKLKFIEDASAGLEEYVRNASNDKKARSVLIVDESGEHAGEAARNIPVALGDGEIPAAGQTTDSAASKSIPGDQAKLEKEARELAKEAKKEQKKEEKEQKEQNEQSSATQGASPDVPGDVAVSDRYAEALKYAQQGNFTKAREEFKKLANDSNLSRNDRASVRALYADMIEKGKGGPSELKEALFWFEKAAEDNEYTALLRLGIYYAELQPSTEKEKTAYADKALKFFERAADVSKEPVPKVKYLEVCENKPVSRSAVVRACQYCDALAAQADDAYRKKQYEEQKQKIKKIQKNLQKKGRSKAPVSVPDILVCLGGILTIVGDLYIFMSLQNMGGRLSGLFGTGGEAADADGVIAKMISFFMEKADHPMIMYVPKTLTLGMILFIAGSILKRIRKSSRRNAVVQAFCEVSFIATLLTVFANIALYIFPGGSFNYMLTAAAVSVIMIAAGIIATFVTGIFAKQ